MNRKAPKLQLRFSVSFQWVNKPPVQHLCIFLHIKRCYSDELFAVLYACALETLLGEMTCMIFIDREHALQKSGCWDLFLLKTRVCKKAFWPTQHHDFWLQKCAKALKTIICSKTHDKDCIARAELFWSFHIWPLTVKRELGLHENATYFGTVAYILLPIMKQENIWCFILQLCQRSVNVHGECFSRLNEMMLKLFM